MVKIAVFGLVSGGIGQGMKDMKGARLNRITDRIIGIVIQTTDARLDMTADWTITTRTVVNREMIVIITQDSAMKII